MTTAAAGSPILDVRGLTKSFGLGPHGVNALDDVSLSLEKGKFVSVMGASGSGKSTLLHLSAGLTRPSSGTVSIAGTDIASLGDHAMTLFRRKHIGLVFQAFNLIPSLSAEENIALPLLLSGASGKETTQRVDELVEKLGLSAVRARRPDAMSGGEQQRVAVGRALVGNPSLVLADEPTGNLDSANGQKLCGVFHRLCEESGATVLMVTHNPAVAFTASQFLILRDGRLARRLDKSECPTLQDLNQAYLEVLGLGAAEVAA